MGAPKIKGFRFEKMTGCYRRTYPVAGRMLTIMVPASDDLLSSASADEVDSYVHRKAKDKLEYVMRHLEEVT